ncbi:Mus7/MMS22 family-domain-containing protein [Hygrophoropsis aurantiaca]|uniref:Mus7/MMS22 family-domain-containing protein n=1 Tax=Hygrophoropsis aurantiaca TaxID=72124 RepID=A0ACB8AM60_9AGAM|nr:Mus7/MMS22 family-domain-containing protein [Hygrophoropsis aurantiaca]
MYEEEIVETSDIEELEVLCEPEESTTKPFSVNQPHHTHARLWIPDSNLVSSPCYQIITAEDLPSPRKRAKVSHLSDDRQAALFSPIDHLPSSLSGSIIPSSQPSNVFEASPTPTLEQAFPLRTPDMSIPALSPQGTPSHRYPSVDNLSPLKQTPPNVYGRENPECGAMSEDVFHEEVSENPSLSLRSRSQSAEPWSLFSSPIRRSPGLSRAPNDENSAEVDKVSQDLSRERESSPLTPTSSMILSRHHHRINAPQSPAPQLTPIDVNPEDVPDDEPHNRYALRRRQARQLNPYAYDKLQYKQQMRSNPDAIVKFRSPQRHHSLREGSGDEATQDMDTEEFVLPAGDLDNDDDYIESTRRRQRRNTSEENIDPIPNGHATTSGWLPEILKDLSSSDTDNDELRREIRAQKVKEGEEASKSRKRRLKRFPLHRISSSTHHQRQRTVASQESSPLAPLRGRSVHRLSPRSDNAWILPPSRRNIEEPRLSSTSPVRFGSPAISIADGYSNNDPLTFGDADSVVDIPSRSPSPRATSTDNDSHADSSFIQSVPFPEEGMVDADSDGASSHRGSSPILNSKDKKRLRILGRMVPAVMLNHLGNKRVKESFSRRQSTPLASIDADPPGLLLPGQTKIRRTAIYRDLEIKGDSESSDIERAYSPPTDNTLKRSQSTPNTSERDGPSSNRRVYSESDDTDTDESNSVISISSDDNVDDATINEWVADRPNGGRGPAHEKSLVDYMLKRTRMIGESKGSSRRSKPSGRSRQRGKPKLDVITTGARRHGQGYQSLLSFERSSTREKGQPRAQKHTDRAITEADVHKKEKRRSRKKTQARLYNFNAEGTRISSRVGATRPRPRRTGEDDLVIDQVDEGFHQALDPLWREPVNKANLPPRPHTQHRPAVPPTHNVASSKPRAVPKAISSWSPKGDYCRIKVDLGIHVLPSGITFAPNTYIGRGSLHQLVSLVSEQSDPVLPTSYSAQGVDLNAALSLTALSTVFGGICGRLGEYFEKREDLDSIAAKEWDNILRTCCQLVSWLSVGAEEEELRSAHAIIQEHARNLVGRIENTPLNSYSLPVYWFSIELSVRLMCAIKNRPGYSQSDDLIKYIMLLMKGLFAIGLQKTLVAVMNMVDTADSDSLPRNSSIAHQSAELWVCLFHLISNFETRFQGEPSTSASDHPFWRLVQRLLQDETDASESSLEASENTWRTIFSFCALSQFSVHGMSTSGCRLPAFWDAVSFALKQIRLAADPEADRRLIRAALEKRDNYIRLITSRCFLLWSRWKWHLDDALPMFSQLVEIFKSRKFANLCDELPDFLSFMLSDDIQLLSSHRPTDTAFELFLKLVVQAAQTGHEGESDTIIRQKSSQVKKILHLAVPVGSVPFTKSQPPPAHDLSMLYNRLSAMAVTILIDPSLPNIRHRLGQARRCVNFKEADINSRNACIRASKCFAVILRHHCIPLTDILGWLEEMTTVLVEEYQASYSSNVKDDKTSIVQPMVVLNIHMLLGSVRQIIETQSLDPTRNDSEYPDPALLEGSWVTKIFSPANNNLASGRTGTELRQLVQSFLNARSQALPKPHFPQPKPEVESQESQDEYGQFSLDFNDPELLAALGDAGPPTIAEYKSQEEAVCKVIDKIISPALYRLVCKQFGDNEGLQGTTLEDYCYSADRWIDCWVGCVNVLVQNRIRDWSLYMKLGPQSWERIIDATWRRRVGLRFNLTLLQLDPSAYLAHRDHFISILLESSVCARVTLEHEYVSIVFTLDGLQHPLLRGITCDLPADSVRYEISKVQFPATRMSLLSTVFGNLSENLRTNKHDEVASGTDQIYLGFLVSLVSAMRDAYENETNGEGHIMYRSFCTQVAQSLLSHEELTSQPRLSHAIQWSRSIVPKGASDRATENVTVSQ